MKYRNWRGYPNGLLTFGHDPPITEEDMGGRRLCSNEKERI